MDGRQHTNAPNSERERERGKQEWTKSEAEAHLFLGQAVMEDGVYSGDVQTTSGHVRSNDHLDTTKQNRQKKLKALTTMGCIEEHIITTATAAAAITTSTTTTATKPTPTLTH